MSELMSAGGALSYLVLGLAALGLLALVGLAGASVTKRRIPLTALVLMPMAVSLIGAVGAWMGAGTLLAGIAGTPVDEIPAVAMAGHWEALTLDWFARWVAAYMFAAATWAATVGAVMVGDDSRFTPMAAVGAAMVTLLGAVICGIYMVQKGVSGMPLIILLLVCGAGVTVASTRRALYEQAERVAGMRFAASICAVLAVSYGGRALVMGSRMEMFGPEGAATSAATLMEAITAYTTLAAPPVTLAWIAFAAVLGIAFCGFYAELGEVVERYTLVDVHGVLLLMVVLGLARVVEHQRTDAALEVGTNHPAAVLFDDMGADLAPALLSIEKNVTEVKPGDGGFGDVIVFKSDAWTRRYKWNGGGWDEDETPLEQVQFQGLRPLFVVGSGEEATNFAELLEKTPDREALLMLRAAEVKADLTVPRELAYKQVTFLQMKLSDSRDLTKELWCEAGCRQANWGPTTWFGEDPPKEPLAYFDAVYEDTQAPGIHTLLGEKSRVKDIVSTCLPTVMTLDGTNAKRVDRWCTLSGEETRALLDEAMEAWPVPEAEHARLVVAEVPELLDEDEAADRIMRELGAIDFCLQTAVDDGEEELDGKMSLNIKVTKRGNLETSVDEDSKNQHTAVMRCVSRRMKKVDFEGYFEPEDYPRPPKDEEEEWEPPTIKLLLDVRIQA